MEHKTFPAYVKETNEDQGIVKAVFALFGNLDNAKDIAHPGSFAKTFQERGRKVRVLDQHRTDSIMRVIGKPLSLREVGREDLPNEVKAEYPDVTGGAEAEIQFLMDTPEGKGAFIRLKEGAVDEWSFGYDALDADFSKVMKDGDEVTVRNLRTLKLYEISPVLFACNPATATVSAKADNAAEDDDEDDNEPDEVKPAPDVTENTIRMRMRDPDDFDPNAFGEGEKFRTTSIGGDDNGITATIGKLEGEDSTTVQSYVFDREQWDVDRAQAWVDEHKGEGKALTEEDVPEVVPDEEQPSYTCECIDCGHTMTTPKHCRDVKCPECGGEMRRAERPGPGQRSSDEGEDMDLPGKSDDTDAETKEGRILARHRADNLLPAVITFLNFLEDAGIDIPGYEKMPEPVFPPPEEEEGKGAPMGLLYKEITEQGPTTRLRSALEGAIHKVFTMIADDLHIEGYLSREERIALSGAIGDALDAFGNAISEELAQRVVSPYVVAEAMRPNKSNDAPDAEEAQAASESKDQQDDERAGPSDGQAPTSDDGEAGPPQNEAPTQQAKRLARIRIERAKLDLLEE